MYYEMLAMELLNVKFKLLRLPAHRDFTKIMRGELFVLNYLKNSDCIVHPKDLSKKLAVSTARIARLLKHMEEQNLIIRQTDAQDSRQVIVQLTEQGAKEIEGARKAVLEHTTRMLESLGAEDAKEYIRIQKKIYQTYLNMSK